MTTPSTPTSTMKEAEDLARAYARAFHAYHSAEESENTTDLYTEQNAARARLIAHIRSLVEAQPSAVAGEALSVVTQYELTPQERDLLTAKGVSHIPGRGEGAAAPSVEPRLTEAQLREIREAGEYVANARRGVPVAPSVEPTKEDELRQALQRANANTAHWKARALAAAPVETEQPTCRCEREGLEKFLCSAGCHLPHKDGILQTEPAAPVETEQPVAYLYRDDADALKLAQTRPGPSNEFPVYARPTPAAGVPPGFVMVPSEPTEEMIRAFTDSLYVAGTELARDEAANLYRVMLAARPLPGGVPTGLSRDAFDAFASRIGLPTGYNARESAWEAWQEAARRVAALSTGAPSSPNPALTDALESFDHALSQWAQAYPLTAFPEPDFKAVGLALGAAGITLDSVSASSMRHVVTTLDGLFAPVRAAMKESPHG